MKDMFMEAVFVEQERIQKLIDLSTLKGAGRGSLKLMNQGHQTYACERWQKKGEPERVVYLGRLDSEPVRELFSIKFQEKRLDCLLYDRKLLGKFTKQYQQYDFATIVSEMPRAYQAVARENSFNQRYEEIRKWAGADYPKNPHPFPLSENYA